MDQVQRLPLLFLLPLAVAHFHLGGPHDGPRGTLDARGALALVSSVVLHHVVDPTVAGRLTVGTPARGWLATSRCTARLHWVSRGLSHGLLVANGDLRFRTWRVPQLVLCQMNRTRLCKNTANTLASTWAPINSYSSKRSSGICMAARSRKSRCPPCLPTRRANTALPSGYL